MVSVGRGSILLLPKQVEGDEFDWVEVAKKSFVAGLISDVFILWPLPPVVDGSMLH
jgi:hypothetical protein